LLQSIAEKHPLCTLMEQASALPKATLVPVRARGATRADRVTTRASSWWRGNVLALAFAAPDLDRLLSATAAGITVFRRRHGQQATTLDRSTGTVIANRLHMSKLDLAIVLATSAVLGSCATGRIAESTAPQDPPARTTETRTTDPVTGRTTTTTTTTPTPRPQDTRPRDLHGDYETAIRIRHEHPWEVTLTGGGSNDENFDVGGGQLSGSAGYYFSEWTELSLRHSVNFSDDEGLGEDVWDFQTRVAFDLHFPAPVVTPYVGALIGYLYGNSDVLDDTFALGPEAGVKIYLQHDAFLQIGAEWVFFTDRDSTIDDTFEDGQIFYFAGFGLRF
jgi:hypothetical protein